MAKAYIFFANGLEDIEALAAVDIFRRGGIDVKTVSITGSLCVTTSSKVTIQADMLFEDGRFDDADMLILPGGAAPGAHSLNEHVELRNLLVEHNHRGTKLAAICAAPMVLGGIGVLRGKRATCYPGYEIYLDGATYTEELVTVDGNVTTGRGPGASFAFAYTLLAQLIGDTAVQGIRDGMIYTQLMESR